ncbi:uncharacterized protein LOC112056341 [Bicyclus anynana]|uniref:Uncharacterized protein LOC112056341 n=1 Tax=Bicyclus anynana TaxID=110368 RepID=A0A6J1P4F1_BICAN|nr:uncharacterized protein LOC112056341 [Bicyclus anynana]
MTYCTVPKCREVGVHRFPKNEKILKRWLQALCREKSSITVNSRLCGKHFLESDYETYSKYTGFPNLRKVLKKEAVPSIFPWCPHLISDQPTDREQRPRHSDIRKKPCLDSEISIQSVDRLPGVSGVKPEYNVSHNLDVSQEILNHSDSPVNESDIKNKSTRSVGTQTLSILKLFPTDVLFFDSGKSKILVWGRLEPHEVLSRKKCKKVH